ncbi:retrovirus-related pol polyprotein from transposon TNT 1-94 [Tanacetum coccineum]
MYSLIPGSPADVIDARRIRVSVLINANQCLIGTGDFEILATTYYCLYCLGKEYGENIMKSIKEGTISDGNWSQMLRMRIEGAIKQGPVRIESLTTFQLKQTGTGINADIRANNNPTSGGLKESNCDQLYAYLKQHEVHANENRIMMERFCQPNNDPLALEDRNRGALCIPSQAKPIKCNICNGGLGTHSSRMSKAKANSRIRRLKGQDASNASTGSGAVMDEETCRCLLQENSTNTPCSSVDHYKSKTEEVTLLKKDFKQKEDKFLEEFLDIKKLKDKIEDRLYKQDQSVQTVHMLCKPKSFYDEKHKVAIGYKNPLCLARAKQAQSALYNGHVLVTTNHTPTVIHDSEDTLELAEITRNRMLLKMQSPLVNDSTEASGSKPRSNTKKNRILPAKKENKKEVEVRLRTNKSVWTKVNRVDSSISSKRVVPTVRIVLNKEKQIWKPKGKLSDNSLNKTKQIWKPKSKLSDNSLNKTKQIWKPKGKLSDNSLSKTQRVWKATGKLFADIGYQWRPTGKKLTLGKLDCGSQWRPTGKKFALGEICQFTKLSVKCRTGHALVSGLRLLKTYDGESFKAHEFCGKVHRGNFVSLHDKKPDLTFFRVFGALCYPTNDSENLGKFQAKADIGIFVGYAPSRKGYRIYNKRTRRLMETIHVTFDEMHQSMAPVRMSSGPEPFIMTPGQLKSGLAPTDKELEMLFQPMFDEYLEQSRVNEPVPSTTEVNAQVAL